MPRSLLWLVVLASCTGGSSTTTKPTTPQPTPQPTPAPQPTTPQPTTSDCSAYPHEGEVYDCLALDQCAEEDEDYLAACCACDERYCAPEPPKSPPTTEGCGRCHTIENIHPYPPSAVRCTTCHGGVPEALDLAAHVPPPPQIGDRTLQATDPYAYFNRLTLTGIDTLPGYSGADGTCWDPLDWLQFVNPGDLRVVSDGRGCGLGGCHEEHAQWVTASPLGSDRIVSTALSSMGLDHPNVGPYANTAASVAWREQEDPSATSQVLGSVRQLEEIPSGLAELGGTGIHQDPGYAASLLPGDQTPDHQITAGSNLEAIVQETLVGACADCHAYSAGANNRAGDYRASGCTSCHMAYALDGRSRSVDPQIDKLEPADPDAIAAPERPHPQSHEIRSVARLLPASGGFQRGMTDQACAGCHQGTNATVLQYWGLRVDPGRLVRDSLQYPANPVSFADASGDVRLFDPAVGNTTFNGHTADQILAVEDYDGDGRDDTPPDVHHAAGLGCIDCHGSRDVHGGSMAQGDSPLLSHQSQVVGIACDSCHGGVDAGPTTTGCTTYEGVAATCVTDRFGEPLRNVTVDGSGRVWLTSRVDGVQHYVSQVRERVVNTGTFHPLTGEVMYSPEASYAMGRADGSVATGIGPMQVDPNLIANGFSHMDSLSCESCHAAWTNNCIGCHLTGIYDDSSGNELFNNVDGDQVVMTYTSELAYTSPAWFSLGATARDEIGSGQLGASVFFRYVDLDGVTSPTLAFSDLNSNGNSPGVGGRGAFGALQHARVAPHSIRGAVDDDNEGVGQCVRCHLTQDGIDRFNANGEYTQFRDDLTNRNYANLDYALLADHIGSNPGNQLNSPYYVHMVVGLGTGLLQFDATGCPNNPLDVNAGRAACGLVAPADGFDPNATAYDLDKLVEPYGISNASNPQPLSSGFSPHRLGAYQPSLAGPLGTDLTGKLADEQVGIVLDAWFDADGAPQGGAPYFLP